MATLTNERGHIGSAGISLARRLDAIAAHGRRRRRGRRATGWPSSSPVAARCRRWAAGRVRWRRWPPASPSSASRSSCSTPRSSRPTCAGADVDARRRRVGAGSSARRAAASPAAPPRCRRTSSASACSASRRSLGRAAERRARPGGARPARRPAGRGRGRGGGPPRWPSSARSRGSRGRRRAPRRPRRSSGSKVRTSSSRRKAWPSRRRAVISGEKGPCTSAARRIGVTASRSSARWCTKRSSRSASGRSGGTGSTSTATRSTRRSATDACSVSRSSKCWNTLRTDTFARSATRGAVGRRSPSSSRPMVASTIASRVRSERRVRPSVGGASCTVPAGYVHASRSGLGRHRRAVVGDEPPPVARAQEHVHRRHRAAAVGADQVLVDGHPGGVAVHRHVLVGEDELQRAAGRRTARTTSPTPRPTRGASASPGGCTTRGRRAPTRRTWRRGRGPRRRRRSAGWPRAPRPRPRCRPQCSSSAAGSGIAPTLFASRVRRPTRMQPMRYVTAPDGVVAGRARARRRRPPHPLLPRHRLPRRRVGAAVGRARRRLRALGDRLPRPRRLGGAAGHPAARGRRCATTLLAVVDDLGARARAAARRRPLDGRRRAAAGRAGRARAPSPGLWLFEPIVPPPGAMPRRHGRATASPTGAATAATDLSALRRGAGATSPSKPPLNVARADALHAYVRHGLVAGEDGAVHLACRPDDEARSSEGGGAHGAFDHLGEVDCPVGRGCGGEPFGPAAFAPAIAEALPQGRLERPRAPQPLRSPRGARPSWPPRSGPSPPTL